VQTRQQISPGKPVPYRRSNNVVRKEFRKRLRGKPSHVAGLASLPQVAGIAIVKTLQVVLILVTIAAFMLAGIGGGMLIGYIQTTEPVSAAQITNQSETSRILDSEGNEIAILTGSQNINREFIAFSKVKHTYIDEAIMAIEDERYLDHIGIDPKRIASAILSALANGGNATHGGSTITQQTVKLLSGADERSAQRKIQEWYNAVRLEQDKSKDEIMELYINLIPMGNSYVGLQSASLAYFGKDAADLNLVESAFLAGIPNRPATYNPLTESGRRNAMRRMRIVLGKMHDLEMIDDKEYETALNTEIKILTDREAVSANQINSYFVDYVIGEVVNDLVAKRGYNRNMAEIAVYNQGLRITTTMDPKVQSDMEITFKDEKLFVKNESAIANMPSRPQGSMVVIENYPNPGQIKGIVGGFGEKTGNFVLNRAVSAQRQPGSSIKPLAVYGPALDTGRVTAASIFTDQPYYLNSSTPTKVWPKNASAGYRGNLSIRDAVKYSVNTIAAYVWVNVLGGETSLQYLAQVGLPRPTENYPSISLGGFSKGMTTLEMAGAYTVFANKGLYTKPYAYTKVVDADGKVLLENRPEFQQVYKPETAYIMTDILRGVMTSGGTANGNAVPNMPTAGKTGTTDDNVDKWLVGYTPYYTAAVWYGYDNRLGRTEIPSGDRNNARGIWTDAMTRIHEGLEKREFEKPKTIKTSSVCTESGMLATPFCPTKKSEMFVPNAMMNPKEDCNIHTAPEIPDIIAELQEIIFPGR